MKLENAMKIMDAYRFGECENKELQAKIRVIYPILRDVVNKMYEEGILTEE